MNLGSRGGKPPCNFKASLVRSGPRRERIVGEKYKNAHDVLDQVCAIDTTAVGSGINFDVQGFVSNEGSENAETVGNAP